MNEKQIIAEDLGILKYQRKDDPAQSRKATSTKSLRRSSGSRPFRKKDLASLSVGDVSARKASRVLLQTPTLLFQSLFLRLSDIVRQSCQRRRSWYVGGVVSSVLLPLSTLSTITQSNQADLQDREYVKSLQEKAGK